MTRLVTVLLTLAVPDEAEAEDAAGLAADAAASIALDVVAAFGVEGHLPVPGSVVQYRRGRQPWRVASVNEHGAELSNLAGELVRLPLSVLVPDRVEIEHPAGGGGCEHADAAGSSVSPGSGADMGKGSLYGPRRDCSRHR